MAPIQILLLALPTLVWAAGKAPAGHEFIPPGPGDMRAPCPGLNSAANHGFLPRNGKNISPLAIATGLKEGLNIGLDFGSVVGALAVLSSPNPPGGTFDLDNLREHNFPIEHDVSLSRQDFYEGDNLHFNQTVFNEVLSFYQDRTTIPGAAHSIWSRARTQRRINGNKEIYGARQFVFSLSETSLYMSTMGNPITGNAPVVYVKSLFEKERLPYELGWTAPVLETSFDTLAAMASQIVLADPGDFGANIPVLTADLLKDVYQLKDPITGVIINSTCAISGTC